MRAWIAGLSCAAAIAVSALTLTAPLALAAADTIDEARVEAIIERLLTEKPELVIDAIRAYQAREEAAKADEQRKQVLAQKDSILGNPNDPFIGNPDAKYTVVEFFDYRCGFCKRSLQTVLDLVERNKDVRVVFKEFPILGEESVLAARVSLALQKVAPQNYGKFHETVMRHRGTLSEEALLAIATKVGANATAVQNAMKDPSIQETIRNNYRLAEALNIRGTPAFIIGDAVIPGAVDLATLERLIADLRS
tara:strand:+ start:1651 stop:2403 length:753 start_codon:yes stop_codon:yes gene_type:complete